MTIVKSRAYCCFINSNLTWKSVTSTITLTIFGSSDSEQTFPELIGAKEVVVTDTNGRQWHAIYAPHTYYGHTDSFQSQVHGMSEYSFSSAMYWYHNTGKILMGAGSKGTAIVETPIVDVLYR